MDQFETVEKLKLMWKNEAAEIFTTDVDAQKEITSQTD